MLLVIRMNTTPVVEQDNVNFIDNKFTMNYFIQLKHFKPIPFVFAAVESRALIALARIANTYDVDFSNAS